MNYSVAKFIFAVLLRSVQASADRSLQDAMPSCPQDFTNVEVLTDTLTLLWEVDYGATANKDILRVCMESQSEGWLGFGISPSGMMIEAEAIIGLPDDGTVLKYQLNGKSSSEVIPMTPSDQTLMNTNIQQKDGVTVMSFEKYLKEDQYPILLGEDNTFIFAHGTGNDLGYHGSSRGDFVLSFDEAPAPYCPQSLPYRETLTDTLTLFYDVLLDTNANKNKIRVCMESESEGWLGFGISPSGMMTGAEAIIGLPDDGTVLKYELNGKSTSAVVPMNSLDQTLMNTNIEQREGATVLSFEKFLDEDQYPIVLGEEHTFIYAEATGNALGYHGSLRGNFTLFFDDIEAPSTSTEPTQIKPYTEPSTNKSGKSKKQKEHKSSKSRKSGKSHYSSKSGKSGKSSK